MSSSQSSRYWTFFSRMGRKSLWISVIWWLTKCVLVLVVAQPNNNQAIWLFQFTMINLTSLEANLITLYFSLICWAIVLIFATEFLMGNSWPFLEWNRIFKNRILSHQILWIACLMTRNLVVQKLQLQQLFNWKR